MTQKKRDYLKHVFSFDLTCDTEKMLSARHQFLAGKGESTPAQQIERRREAYWELQEIRDEFWDITPKARAKKLETFFQNAPSDLLFSVKHLQEVSLLEPVFKKIEEDLDLDPVFIEQLKTRILWSNAAVPGAIELRSVIPTKKTGDFHLIKKSVRILRRKYPKIAKLVPQWLDMIATSQENLESDNNNDNSNQWFDQTQRQNRYNEDAPYDQTEEINNADEEAGCGCSEIVTLLFALWVIGKIMSLFFK